MSNRKVREAKKAVKQYRFRDSYARSGVTAQVVGEELERITTKNGVLHASDVVEEARPDDAPLHPAFEWRDPVAAESWRKHQARELIRSVEVVVELDGVKSSSPVYVSVPQNVGDGSRKGYQPVDVVVTRPDLYAIALSEALANLTKAEESVRKLREAAEATGDAERLAKVTVAMQAAQVFSAAVHALH